MRDKVALVGIALILLISFWPCRADAQAQLSGTYIYYLGVGANGIMVNTSDHSMVYRETSTGSLSGDVWFPGTVVYEVIIEATGTSNFVVRNEYTATEISTTSATATAGRSITWSGAYTSGSHGVTLDLEYTYEMDDRYVLIIATVTNTGSVDLSDVYFMIDADPDQGYQIGGNYHTYNDVHRQPPTQTSALVTSGVTNPRSYYLGLGAADGRARASAVGRGGLDPSNTWATPTDPGGTLADVCQSIVFRETSLAVGSSTTFQPVYVWGTSTSSVITRFDSIDHDGDGYTLLGGDCDDSDDTVNPGVTTDPCDGKDNDCNTSTLDGSTESWLGTVCDSSDSDLCEDGTFECTGGVQFCNDDLVGIADVCDGADNDCDSTTPDGSGDSRVGASCDGADADLCEEGTGVCVSGTFSCTDDTGDTPDTCNSLDDDCDSTTPDGAHDPMLGAVCDGADADLCEEGTLSCVGGALACSDATEDTPDVCDGVDNDCDPASEDGDEDPLFGVACDGDDPDLCAEGSYSCVDATLVCSDTMEETPEQCDGIDNDCDPSTVDGSEEEWYLQPCDGSDSDLCEEGEYDCVSGSQVCGDSTGDILDLCNGDDDDCDPETVDGADEDWHGAPCDGPDTDLCIEGEYECDGSGRVCSDDTDDTTEECNGTDDDCNPHTDEDEDNDGDGFSTCDGDCHDADPAIHPDAEEDCSNGLDDNCDGLVDADDPSCDFGERGAGCSCATVPGRTGTAAVVLLLVLLAAALAGRRRG